MQNKIDLQINKEITIKLNKWTANTKKDFLEAIKKEKVDEINIINTLVLPYIEVPEEVYLNPDELQYILINLRKISYNKAIDFKIRCSNCREVIECNNDVLDFCSYKMGKFPAKFKDFKFNNIKSNFIEVSNIIDNLAKHGILPNIAEMLLHITEYKNRPINTFEEIYEIYENLDLETINDLENFYNDNKSSLELKLNVNCKSCKKSDTYYFLSIPQFFDILLPKEMIESLGSLGSFNEV